jgi:hypothetical protein
VYVHGDYYSGRIRGATRNADGTWTATVLRTMDFNISAFGEDEAGELYAVSLAGAVYRLVSG